jgi:hypothetical protein
MGDTPMPPAAGLRPSALADGLTNEGADAHVDPFPNSLVISNQRQGLD